MKLNILFCAMLLLAGCVIPHAVIVTSQTVLGASVSENPQTQLYEARFGFARNEFAFVPTDTNGPIPDVIMEIRVNNIYQGGGIYQRLAVGSNAVSQPGAALMFAKDATGNTISNAVHLIPLLQHK